MAGTSVDGANGQDIILVSDEMGLQKTRSRIPYAEQGRYSYRKVSHVNFFLCCTSNALLNSVKGLIWNTTEVEALVWYHGQ